MKKIEDKQTLYRIVKTRLEGYLDGISYPWTCFANMSALLYEMLEDINWVGFYILVDEILLLGPFQGKPACAKIEVGKGVCGTAIATDSTQLVSDVHEFPGHIACDCASNSELVVPIHVDGRMIGVLDIDSPIINRFEQQDKEGTEQLVHLLENYLNKIGTIKL